MKKTNTCKFIGRLTKDPTLMKNMNNPGQARVVFALAVETPLTAMDGKPYDKVAFPRFQAWGEEALNLAASLKKGQDVEIEARFETRTYKKDGELIWDAYFVIEDLTVLNGEKTQTA